MSPACATPLHGWTFTAPWWHWKLGAGEAGALFAPVLQKYATPDLVNEYLADPQRRLVCDLETDFTQPPPYDARTLAPVATDAPPLLKVYLPTHHRQYIVTGELHCDLPGLPNVDRESICQMGFVVRRRSAEVSAEYAVEARSRLRLVARDRARLGVIDRRLRQAAAAGRIGRARFAALADQRAIAVARLADREASVRNWANAIGVTRTLQGWVPLGVDTDHHLVEVPPRPDPAIRPLAAVGHWRAVPEIPDVVTEHVFPLYPLIPDPARPDHDGTGRTVVFGVVPTAVIDLELPIVDDDGGRPPGQDRAPRFDDLSVYEIRLLARRHDPACPRQPGKVDCCGALTWSSPTSGYRLASAMDARGTAHRPVTIRLPSREELRAGAAVGPGMGGLRIASPDINLDLAAGGDPAAAGSFQICSFGVPLITIVATFVLKLFLPIVTFLFGLWILLSFRLCIPPSIELDATAKVDLDAQPPEFEASAAFEASWDSVHPTAKLRDGVDKQMLAMTGGTEKAGVAPDPDLPTQLPPGDDGTSPADRFRLFRALAAERLSAPTDDLRYENRVIRAQVPVP